MARSCWEHLQRHHLGADESASEMAQRTHKSNDERESLHVQIKASNEIRYFFSLTRNLLCLSNKFLALFELHQNSFSSFWWNYLSVSSESRCRVTRNACSESMSGSFKSNNVLKFHTKRFECRVTDSFGTIDDRLSMARKLFGKRMQLFIWGSFISSFSIGSSHFKSEM